MGIIYCGDYISLFIDFFKIQSRGKNVGSMSFLEGVRV